MRGILTAVFFLFGCINVFADEIRVGGGGAAINAVFTPIRPHFEKATGIYLSNIQSTPKDGLIDLINGKVDAATAAHPLETMISSAEKDGINVNAATLEQVVVGENKTVVFVHKDNPVVKLTKEQLKGIFTGNMTNWKDVGGNDSDIIVVWGRKTPGQNGFFVKQILDGEPVLSEVINATDYKNIQETIEANPDAIGIDPVVFERATTRVVETDPELMSSIILVTKGKPSPDMRKLIDFIKGEGQKYIRDID